ncbi:MAG TPA: AlpA family phage regulatory protein [Stellaceae bacterium]|nr:AlpA family phage regulatory protein [Stellaceae bacterium]
MSDRDWTQDRQHGTATVTHKRTPVSNGALSFSRAIRRSELRQIVPVADTTNYEMEQRGEFPRRFYLTPRCVEAVARQIDVARHRELVTCSAGAAQSGLSSCLPAPAARNPCNDVEGFLVAPTRPAVAAVASDALARLTRCWSAKLYSVGGR